MHTQHEPGLILTNLQLERIIDADTVELSVTRKFKIRIRDVNAPELNTPEGQKAKELVESLFCFVSSTNPPSITVFIPSNHPEKLLDFHSFDRIVGDLIVNGIDIGQFLQDTGYDQNET